MGHPSTALVPTLDSNCGLSVVWTSNLTVLADSLWSNYDQINGILNCVGTV